MRKEKNTRPDEGGGVIFAGYREFSIGQPVFIEGIG